MIERTERQTIQSTLRELNMTKEDILALDPMLFSAEDKIKYINSLEGHPILKPDLDLMKLHMRRWKGYLNEEMPSGKPFRVGYELLLKKAKFSPPKKTRAYASDFSDWIFSLYYHKRDAVALLHGQEHEQELERLIKNKIRHEYPLSPHSNWKNIFYGMGSSESDAKTISELTVNGTPMRGKPDLVFQEKKTKRIIIVEIKASRTEIPSDGWPNLRAQLWAYSKIDEYKDAPEVILVGEIWHGLYCSKIIRWQKRDEKFERENTELFNCYTHNPNS